MSRDPLRRRRRAALVALAIAGLLIGLCADGIVRALRLLARLLGAAALVCLLQPNAAAHDRWGNGDPVPDWVKRECCGPEDVHRLPASAVHIRADGYHIDGIETVVPMGRALASPDGFYWAFWNPAAEPAPIVFCFSAPVNGV